MSNEDSTAKKTPLHSEHEKLGARMMSFGGWDMPIQYSGIVDEHRAVREALGVFDISHMGQLFATGPEAASWLNGVLSNDIARLEVGDGQYTFLLNENGGVIDDLIIYRTQEETFLLVVNAARIDIDMEWLAARTVPGATLENASDAYAGLAVQGPNAAKLFDRFFGEDHSRPARNEIHEIEANNAPFLIARTGYTGEDGFELFFPAALAVQAWHDILERGGDLDIKPCGLGARDTLRLEMCYPLNGSDLSPERTPLEAGLSFFIALEKGDFIGRDALVRQRENGIPTRLVPFMMEGKCPPPRAHYPVMRDGAKIGEVSSGTLSPTLGAGIGMAYLPAEFARIGEHLEIDIRGRSFPATIQKKPFYKKS